MKRYWKIIVLTGVIVLTFGSYYLQSVIAKDERLELGLVTIAGDEELEDKIIINGDYYETISVNGEFYDDRNRESFILTKDGMKYVSDQGYFERMSGLYTHPRVLDLIKEYRGYMRGKNNIELLYEDDTTLAYVGPYFLNLFDKEFQFDVAILDKESGEENSFTIDVPREVGLDYLTVMSVQLVGEELHVFTQSHVENVQGIVIFKIDINEQTMKSQESLFDTDENTGYSILNNLYNTNKNSYLVIDKYKIELDEQGYENRVSSELLSYHLETGEIQSIDIPEDWHINTDMSSEYLSSVNIIIEDKFIYFVNFTENGILIKKFNMEKNEIEPTSEIALDPEVIDGLSANAIFPNNGEKLGFISTTKTNGSRNRELFIVDVSTEEVIYQGEIKITNAAKEMHVYDIDFYDMQIN